MQSPLWSGRLKLYLKQYRLWQLRPLEELNCFSTAHNSISVLIRHSKPVIKQIDIRHLTAVKPFRVFLEMSLAKL